MWLDHGFHLNIDAASSSLGSISIACWMVAFSPQILENSQRQSCSLSIQLILGWLIGDVFNVIGSICQGVMPTIVNDLNYGFKAVHDNLD
jgi:solute carrier family 66 (lysosomal lysine-arginine transporter), member 1